MYKGKHQAEKSNPPVTFLDTLELTTEIFRTKTHESLYKSAFRKQKTNNKIYSLIDVTTDNNMRSKYWQTFHCKNVLLQQGQSVIGSLCRNRWCLTCSRIKTAEMIHGYSAPLKELANENELYFVTLTAPTIKADKLTTEIRKRIKVFQQCQDALRKQGIKLNGMRKLEITYNEKTNKYHPHFHFIQQGKHESECLRNEWVKRFQNQSKKASNKAQDITPVTDLDEGFMELFKYATKDSVKDSTPPLALDVIYQALQRVRVYQPYGKIRKVKKPVENTNEQFTLDFIPPRTEIWVFDEVQIDWVNGSNENLIETQQIILENNNRMGRSDVRISDHLNV
jgi:plasmid rolling circle replication initiator protein Rep